MPTFFFITTFEQELSSVGGTVIGSITTLSFAILATMLLLNIYEGFARGGKPRDLVISLVKYAACALIIQNWQAFFTDVSTGISSVAVHVSSNDFMSTFSATLAASGGPASNWTLNLLSLALIPLITSVLWAVVALVYYVWMIFFAILYTAWGLVLFAFGPILIALLPSNATSSFAKHYLKSLAEWAAWPLLYAIMGALTGSMSIITSGPASSAFSTSTVLAPAWNLLQNIVLATIYIVFLIVLPFIASHLINGNFATTAGASLKAMALVASGGTAAASAVASVAKGIGGVATNSSGSSGDAPNSSGGGGTPGPGGGGGTESPPPSTPVSRLSAGWKKFRGAR